MRVQPNLSFKGPWPQDFLKGVVEGSGVWLWDAAQE